MDDEFLRQLRATFKVEADEHLQSISNGLMALDRTSAPRARSEIVEAMFRAAHSLKGAAKAVDLTAIEMLCQSIESVFASWRRQNSTPPPMARDTLHRTLDAIGSSLAAPAEACGMVAPALASSLRQSLSQLEFSPSLASTPAPSAPGAVHASPALSGDPPTKPVVVAVRESDRSAPKETVRVAVAKLESQLLEAEEMLAAKLAAAQQEAELRKLAGRFAVWRKAWLAAEPDAQVLRHAPEGGAGDASRHAHSALPRLLDFFDVSLDTLKWLEDKTGALVRAAEQDRHAFGKLADDLLEHAKKLLLLPFATISASFPKLVRDLCRDQGKEADLTIRGEDVEIDKRILEEMKDPLVHLLRNSVDHGIELPAERTRLGKPSRAAITLVVSRLDGNKVQLSLSDDGAGIDLAKVKESALRRGLLSPGEAGQLDDSAAQALIFLSDVSTSPTVSRLSGRGLGLPIVREKAEKLGGEVSVESSAGTGTTFRMLLPATRAAFRGIVVVVAGRLMVVPTAQVERAIRVKPVDIQTIEGHETISYQGRAVPLVQMADVLELPPVERDPAVHAGGASVLILGTGDVHIAFTVDAVLDELEVLVKPLRKPLSRVRNIAAATVLGSGQVAPILNVSDLLMSASRPGSVKVRAPAVASRPGIATRSILIAEDSITSRMLLKAILESAGHIVKTAVDGLDAFSQLRTEHFDLLVSDVEMPRLNGFDLTARIRSDPKLSDLPVVLVTALDTREDRERGVDAGANAYIVKSGFEQGNLLEAVQRLV
ncbi:MAG: hybrid sensor histidine kinase/response regulator [Chitinophagaceae bacterium]|nr:MAG: hybrid sensor histidine kinase/response regulator [Chitinophagaceae bacterium]